MVANWSDILPEMVNSIAREICVYEDLLAFMGVCSSWRFAVTEDKTFNSPVVSRFPSLMLAESRVEEERDYRQLFFLSGSGGGGGGGVMGGKLYLPEARNQRIVSSCGWLMMADEDEIHAKLINPYSRVQIDLPSLSTLDDYKFEGCWHNNTIRKVLLTSSDPFTDPYFRVVVIWGGIGMLGFCKPGDESWTRIDKGWERGAFITDVINHNARQRIYAVCTGGGVYEGDLYGDSPTTLRPLADCHEKVIRQVLYSGPYVLEWDYDSLLVVRPYFTNSDDDDDDDDDDDEDLNVDWWFQDSEDECEEDVVKESQSVDDQHERESKDDDASVFEDDESGSSDEDCDDFGELEVSEWGKGGRMYRTIRFQVYKFSLADGTRKKLFDLSNRALFLGYNSSFSIPASNDGCTVKANCIYFTDDCYAQYCFVKGGGGRNMGIYHVQEIRIEPFSNEESLSFVSPPLWLASSITSKTVSLYHPRQYLMKLVQPLRMEWRSGLDKEEGTPFSVLICTSEDPSRRPSMAEVVQVLESIRSGL